MTPPRPLPRRIAAGFSIVTALFLVVVLSALAVAVMSLTTAQQTSSALDVLGARAYEASRAGVEYGLYQKQINGSCVATRSFPLGATLSSFTVTVLCSVNATPGMPTQLLWGAAALDAGQFPQARLTLTLYTLSLDPKWIAL